LGDQNGWATALVAGLGMLGTVTAGLIGFQSGARAVDKDYVQIAMTIMSQKEASPQMRGWAVRVLNDLSPVPFGAELKEQLTKDGFEGSTLVAPRIELNADIMSFCPDFLRGKKKVDASMLWPLIDAYESCAVKHNVSVMYIKKYNSIMDKYTKPLDQPVKPKGEKR
jgi:hypothetical protein